MRILARSQSGSTHVVTGKVTGGIPGRKAGVGTPFRDRADAIEHLTRNGWEIIEFLD